MELRNGAYYFLKPVIPRSLQILVRRALVSSQRDRYVDVWPIDKNFVSTEGSKFEWPDNKQFAFVLTHDVETDRGVRRCRQLAKLEKSRGLTSSFNFVPERYEVPVELRMALVDEGFEVGVHGLLHDGKLYKSEKIFRERAKKINQYLHDWGAVGFRSPAMHHDLDWIGNLDIEYDASTFDSDPFEPQADGVGRILPFWIRKRPEQSGYIELPYTLPQDFTLFVLMNQKNTDIWRRKLDWIVDKGGMALLNVHPDYLNFNSSGHAVDEYSADLYEDFLDYVIDNYGCRFWNALPMEVARYSRNILNGNSNTERKPVVAKNFSI